MRKTFIITVIVSMFAGVLFAQEAKTFKNNGLEISVAKGEVYVPFKDGKGFWGFKVNVVNTNASEGRTLNAELIMKGGGSDIGTCQIYIALEAGASESKDLNCKHTAASIDDFDVKIKKVYNKKM